MDKALRPHVIRTWTVERTKVLHPQPVKMRSKPVPFRGPGTPAYTPKSGPAGR